MLVMSAKIILSSFLLLNKGMKALQSYTFPKYFCSVFLELVTLCFHVMEILFPEGFTGTKSYLTVSSYLQKDDLIPSGDVQFVNIMITVLILRGCKIH